MTAMPMLAAALSGVPAGVQALGPWAGRRQLFVRFAGEAETATMYLAAALVRELDRQLSRSTFHSVVIGGRDPLASVPFLIAALNGAKPKIPVMLDTDGMRPEELPALLGHLALVQVTVEFTGSEAAPQGPYWRPGTRWTPALADRWVGLRRYRSASFLEMTSAIGKAWARRSPTSPGRGTSATCTPTSRPPRSSSTPGPSAGCSPTSASPR